MTAIESRPRDGVERWERAFRHFGWWCLICGTAAAPSFVFGAMLGGAEPTELAAMAVGVLIFAGLYTEVSTSDWFGRLRRRPFVERTLKIGYGLRLVQSFASVIPPLFIVDVVLGMISLGVAGELLGVKAFSPSPGPHGFWLFLLATLIQGTLLNIVLFVLMLVIYGIQKAFCTPPPLFSGLCLRCNYDLRASKDVCPECGEPIPGVGVDTVGTPAVRL